MEITDTERTGSLVLSGGNSLDAAAPDLSQKSTGMQRQANDQRHPDVDPDTQDGQAKINEEQLDQQRCTLKNLDIGRHQIAQPSFRGRASQCYDQPAQPPESEGKEGENDGPFSAVENEEKFGETKTADHLGTSLRRVGKIGPADDLQNDREELRQGQVDDAEDEIDFKAAEGFRIYHLSDIGQFFRGDRRDKA